MAESPSIVGAPPPPRSLEHADPEHIASYVRAGMHRDRSPGSLLIVQHPHRTHRLPRGVDEALEAAGWHVRTVGTAADPIASARGIRDALRELHATGRPLDVMCVAGDGTLDHHLLTGAYWAFHPDLVHERPGEISVTRPDSLDRAPPRWRALLESSFPTGEGTSTTPEVIHRLWTLRARLPALLRKDPSPARTATRLGLRARDPRLALAVVATLWPDHVTLRPDGLDLSGLARATQEGTFEGLYPFIRAIAVYPAGTASDNALFSGAPGWLFSRFSGLLARWPWLNGLRRLAEAPTRRAVLDFFLKRSAVVPARFAVVQVDGAWRALCSHAVGGPGSGRFFAGDLEGARHGLLGYLALLPRVTVEEGLLGSTVVHARATDADGAELLRVESQLSEALYTNRTFIAGVGSVPSTDPTSFAGRSTFVLAPPIVTRTPRGREIGFSGLFSVIEGATKGILGRLLHGVGLGAGRLAGGGKLASTYPEHQVTLREGETVDMRFFDADGHPRAVPIQVSGDPFQASHVKVRVAWGPLPMLVHEGGLWLASTRRSLARLRVQQVWRLASVVMVGLPHFRHDLGQRWSEGLFRDHGLPTPPLALRRAIQRAQERFVTRWEAREVGSFVDTSPPGVQLGRGGRYAHNTDQTAHLVLLRQPAGALLVRCVRAEPDGTLYETQARYRAFGPVWLLHTCQLRRWQRDEPPVILHESSFLRSADDLQREAPMFFPFADADARQRTTEVPFADDDDL